MPGAREGMIKDEGHHETYQAALAWVTRHMEETGRQGLTLDDLGG
jgi:hypothetical protein